MEVYGLTGGIGSGKSTVATMLEEYGVPVVSADELSRMVVAPGSEGLRNVVEAFGPEVLDERGDLDRKKMGKIVFANPEKRRALEAILHPRIRERYEQVLDALEKAGHPVMIYEVPLLFEKKLHLQDEMKAVLLVACSADTRIARVKDRDALTTEEVLARMQTQMPEEEKRHLADYIVYNDGDLDDLRREVEYLISRYLKLPARNERVEAEIELDAIAVPVGDDRSVELDLHPPARLGSTELQAPRVGRASVPPPSSSDTIRGPAPSPEEVEELEELDAVEEVEPDEDVPQVSVPSDSLQVDLQPTPGKPAADSGRRATMPMFTLGSDEEPDSEEPVG